MSCDLDRETLGGEQSLVTGGGCARAEVNKGTLGAAEVSRGRVEDRVVLGEARCPAPGVGEGALVELGSLEDRTGEDSGGRGLFRCWGTRVQIGEAGSQLIPAHSNFDCISYRPDRTQHCRCKFGSRGGGNQFTGRLGKSKSTSAVMKAHVRKGGGRRGENKIGICIGM